MKTLIILLLLAFSLSAQAQIVSELSFDKKTKTISLKLESQFDVIVFLYPQDEYYENSTYYKVIYKDANGKVVNKYMRPVAYVGDRGSLLTAKETRSYKLKLSPEEANIYSVEIIVHIGVRNAGKSLFVEDISKTYKWE